MKQYWLILLTAAAVMDWKTRQLPAWLLLLGSGPGIWNLLHCGAQNQLWSFIPGIVMLLLAKLTEGALGEGDGLFFLLSGCFLRPGETVLLVLGGLAVSSVWGMGIWVRHIWKPERKIGTVPFLLCIWPAGFWIGLDL